MFLSKDEGFVAALENPELLESRLASLTKDRRRALVLHWFATAVFFFTFFVGIGVYMKSREVGPMAFVVPLMVSMSVQQLATVVSAQNELRTLLMFKKLRNEGHSS
ncbi:hypothetical protein OKA05_04120 [Luteolibacter arcticus]|uniref:Transmembrane protein n=1 Tax=Luteolibacter arcticus TaxID=1581411 RepID=A0ABT3GEJ7_9BACT|nr:hypothetical protein [Luteolibacter arcticus]MCW1921725.1 hypothetical protein [Luteolibacter arcticus]